MIYWPAQRQKESRGFVSKRIIRILVAQQAMLFGTGVIQDFGKFKRVIDPWDLWED